MNQMKDSDLASVTREISQLMLLVSELLKAFYFMLKPGSANIAKCCT